MPRSLACLATLLLAGCLQPDEISVDDAWVRLPAVKGRPAAAYFTVHGGPADSTIIAVTSEVSIRSEMHESVARTGPGGTAGAMSMKPIGSVKVAANADVQFKPGGKHVMLYNLNPVIVPGGPAVLLTLSFADGNRVSRKATVFAAGDPAPE